MGIVLVGRWQPGNTSAWIAHDHAAVRCPVSPTALDAAFTRPSSQLFTDLSKAHTTWLFSNMFQHSSLIRLSHYHSIFFFSRSFLSHCVWHVIGNDDDDDSFIDYQLQSGNVNDCSRQSDKANRFSVYSTDPGNGFMLVDRHEIHGIILSDKLDGSHLFVTSFLLAGSCRSKTQWHKQYLCSYHSFHFGIEHIFHPIIR